MKVGALGGAQFDRDCRRIGQGLTRQFGESVGLQRFSGQIGRQIGQRTLEASGIGRQLQSMIGPPVRFNFQKMMGGPVRFNFQNMFKASPAFEGIVKTITGSPMFLNYELAQRRAGRRCGPVVAALEIPGEVGIGDLTAAFMALAAGDRGRLARLRRRLRAQARRGDTQSAALEGYLQRLLERLHEEELQRMLLALLALVRAKQPAILPALGTSTRASIWHRPPRREQDPVRTRRCSRAPNDASSLPFPEVAA